MKSKVLSLRSLCVNAGSLSINSVISPAEEEEGEEEEEESESDHDENEMEVNFFTLLLAKLLGLHEARDKAVRFRVCQLVAKLMGCAADCRCDVGADLMDSVVECMLQRTHDKVDGP